MWLSPPALSAMNSSASDIDASACAPFTPLLSMATIEPMISIGDWHHEMWDDGWTAVTADRSRTAQFEHTLLVTDSGAEVLTVV